MHCTCLVFKIGTSRGHSNKVRMIRSMDPIGTTMAAGTRPGQALPLYTRTCEVPVSADWVPDGATLDRTKLEGRGPSPDSVRVRLHGSLAYTLWWLKLLHCSRSPSTNA